MSLYHEDAERLLQEAEYGLSSAITDLKQTEYCVSKSPTDENKKWLVTGKEKLTIMYAVVDELTNLVEVTKREQEMMNSEQEAQECDATADAQ
jgi:hypothetical protein